MERGRKLVLVWPIITGFVHWPMLLSIYGTLILLSYADMQYTSPLSPWLFNLSYDLMGSFFLVHFRVFVERNKEK